MVLLVCMLFLLVNLPFAVKKYQAQAKNFTEVELRMAVEECAPTTREVGICSGRRQCHLILTHLEVEGVVGAFLESYIFRHLCNQFTALHMDTDELIACSVGIRRNDGCELLCHYIFVCIKFLMLIGFYPNVITFFPSDIPSCQRV